MVKSLHHIYFLFNYSFSSLVHIHFNLCLQNLFGVNFFYFQFWKILLINYSYFQLYISVIISNICCNENLVFTN